jgi:hypothetical protein
LAVVGWAGRCLLARPGEGTKHKGVSVTSVTPGWLAGSLVLSPRAFQKTTFPGETSHQPPRPFSHAKHVNLVGAWVGLQGVHPSATQSTKRQAITEHSSEHTVRAGHFQSSLILGGGRTGCWLLRKWCMRRLDVSGIHHNKRTRVGEPASEPPPQQAPTTHANRSLCTPQDQLSKQPSTPPTTKHFQQSKQRVSSTAITSAAVLEGT